MNWQKERFSQKQLTNESFDYDNKLTFEKLLSLLQCFVDKDKRRKDGNDF